MTNGTDAFVSLEHWPSAGSFGFTTDFFATNLINLAIVLGVLIFFGKQFLSDLLDNRKKRILDTIQNSEALGEGAIEQLEKARAHLQKMETEANNYRINGYSEIEQKKEAFIKKTDKFLEEKEKNKNETIQLEQQRAINQVRQHICQQALQQALGALNSCLDTELHLRTIRANIGLLGVMKEIRD